MYVAPSMPTGSVSSWYAFSPLPPMRRNASSLMSLRCTKYTTRSEPSGCLAFHFSVIEPSELSSTLKSVGWPGGGTGAAGFGAGIWASTYTLGLLLFVANARIDRTRSLVSSRVALSASTAASVAALAACRAASWAVVRPRSVPT